MTRRALLAGALILVTAAASAAEVARHGLYIEKWPNGRKKIMCWYKKGVLNGSYKEYSEQGKLVKECHYKDGVIEGVYREYYASGRPKLAAQYRAGKITGRLIELDESGKPVRDQVLVGGAVKYARSKDQISADLKRIYAAPPPVIAAPASAPSPEGGTKALRLPAKALGEALAHLKAYRCIAGVPYADITLNARYDDEAQHAAVLLAKIGRLDHHPKRPAGVSEEFYKKAYSGTSRSNLAMGRTSLPPCVDMWMNDSDPTNIDRLGHRRWCLNPAMKQCGFGLSGKFAAIWAHDRARKPVTDFDYIPFPAKGFHPTKYFRPRWAWCVSLNPRKFVKPAKGVAKGKIYELGDDYKEKGGPLELDYENVNLTGFGVPYCVIFRPKSVRVADGARYRVVVEGVKRKGSRRGQTEDGKISYVVEFFSLKR